MTIPTHDPTPATRLLTTELFREVSETGHADELVAVGLALHHFTELVRELVPIDQLELHRATTILTKQLARALDAERPLVAIAGLVTNPERTATADGRSAAELCGPSWSAVRDLAAERATSAITGAETFGEAAVLHLAATRAVRPRCVWWGTHGWKTRVDEWAASNHMGVRVRDRVVSTPEIVDDGLLAEIVDDDVFAA